MATKKPAEKPAPKRKPITRVIPDDPDNAEVAGFLTEVLNVSLTGSLTDCLWCMGEGAEFKLTVQAGRNVVRADIARSGHSHSRDFETADLTDHALCGFLRAADDTLPR